MTLDRLIHHVPPPLNPHQPGTPKMWEKVEARLGLALPPDYKALVDTYGTGSFDGFLIVHNPFAQVEYLNLFYALDTLHEAGRRAQSLGDPHWTAVRPFELYPAAGGLLPWGCTTNLGDTFFWRASGPPENWETVFYNLRSGEYEVWKCPASALLHGLFRGELVSVLFPEDYPPEDGLIGFIPG